MAKKKSDASLDTVNENGRRTGGDRRKVSALSVGQVDRRKAKRRRQIDPTTCEREYNEQEIEFMHALDEYKRISGRMFPTCSEILEVFLGLGYRKVAPATQGYQFNQATHGMPADGLELEFETQTN